MTVSFTDGKRVWVNRFYATFHKPARYYDLAQMTNYMRVPDPEELHPLTDAEWESRMNGCEILAKHVHEGALVDFQYPEVPLHEQATAVLARTTTEMLKTFVVFGEPVPENWQSYLRQLRAISADPDYTGALPTRPSSETTK